MDEQTPEFLSEMICGDDTDKFPMYRTGAELTRFFHRAGLSNIEHDGSTRKWWTLEVLKGLSDDDLKNPVILRLANPREYRMDRKSISKAIICLNEILSPEGLQVELSSILPQLKEVTPNFPIEHPIPKKLISISKPEFFKLKIEAKLSDILSKMWDEVEICVNNGAFLSAIILMGSILEGLLLSVLQNDPKTANSAKSAPVDRKKQKVISFSGWKLAQMIDVAHEVGWIDSDVKKYSHSLRDFRNLVHPNQQMSQNCYPDEDTCQI